MSKSAGKKDDMTFEQCMLGLEAIVDRLEKEELPLDKMADLYEEGMKLSRHCREILDSLQGRISVIQRENSVLKETPFVLDENED